MGYRALRFAEQGRDQAVEAAAESVDAGEADQRGSSLVVDVLSVGPGIALTDGVGETVGQRVTRRGVSPTLQRPEHEVGAEVADVGRRMAERSQIEVDPRDLIAVHEEVPVVEVTV